MPSFIAVEALAGFGHTRVGDIIVVLGEFVDDAARSQLYYAVADGLYELVVVRSHQHIALERLQGVVEG